MFGNPNFSLIASVLIFGILVTGSALTEESSCSRVDFDQATLTFLARCSFLQEFITKRYADSNVFNPYRPEAEFYLSNRWQGLTCGETVNSFSMNGQTELRMVYHLVFQTGATLEIRVVDLDMLDADLKPTVVIRWKTEQATSGWGMFREKMDKVVNRAKVQIEANMNAGSEVAIEYITIFNYEVQTDECSSIDEVLPPSTTTTSTSTQPTTTLSTTPTATTTTTSSTTTATTTTEMVSTPSTTSNSPRDENPSLAVGTTDWVWLALAGVFAVLFCLATTSAAYIYAANRELQRINELMRKDRSVHFVQKEMSKHDYR
ncbi:uncharacterized protein LOC129750644 isoform X3 [Uranotaenia lowii]|uniref:uncharacterized protein LOC129750644 isoform X3 n=1 Tax=Uranotaenia lowii TaxID=190385 RepID=UPI00247A21E4|nr:uncharacterized protein LOC129750644 isoform X3 [Uranotaenia lowii]